MEKKGTDSAVASFLKTNNETLNKNIKRPAVKEINPRNDDICKTKHINFLVFMQIDVDCDVISSMYGK